MATDLQTATLRLKQLCPESEPALDDTEYTNALAAALRYVTRADATAYAVGDVVIVNGSDFNGRTYRCTTAGTSAAAGVTNWPTTDGATMGESITDGTVVWVDTGSAFSSPYDVEAAAKECWRLKASKAVGLVDSSDGTLRNSWSQVYEHCMRMAARFEGAWIA